MPALSTSPHIDPVPAPGRQVWCIRQIPALPVSAEAAGRLAAECQALGFTHLLIAAAEDILGSPGRRDTLASLAKACHAADLGLMIDLGISPVPRTGPLALEQAGWYGVRRGPSDDPPDPRKLIEQPDLVWLRHEEAAVLDQATAWWRARITLSKDLGVGGFRCLLPQHMPARFWRALTRPDMAFLAWAPGITPAQTRDLADCGFAASFVPVTSDLAKVVREAGDAAVIGPVIAVPDNRPAALRLAAGLGAGLMQMDGQRSAEETAAANALAKSLDPGSRVGGWRLLGAPGAPALALARPAGPGLIVAAVNNSGTPQELPLAKLLPHIAPLTRLEPIGASASVVGTDAIALGPGDVKFLRAAAERPITLPRGRGIPLAPALKAPRLAIENVTPAVDGGAFPARRIVGETVQIEADIVVDGHEQVAAALRWRPADSRNWQEVPMRALGNDRWAAPLPLLRLGTHYFTVCAWIDVFGGFRHGLQKLHEAGKDIRLELGEGRDMVRAAADRVEDDALRVVLTGIGDHLAQCPPEEQLRLLLSPETADAMERADPRAFAATTPVAYRLDAERAAARFAAWYELFPRSQSGDAGRHGTFADVIGRLPAIQAMGFDVLYFPPIHPIGATNRKGRNNSLKAEPGDVGSPYAIGAAEGGHDALHPELGSFEDFQRLRAAAADHGLELALDFAIQCAPDHPWLAQHPEWFVWRADGTVRHAQNPPKTYEDIVNVDFYAEGDAAPALWTALRDVVQFWVDQGIRLFRVDNPHTKPLPFWEWLIADIRSRHPDAIFLSEAFTAPRRMYRLAKIGFSQSYTYFTWRNTKAELTEYLRQLNEAPVREFFRPHFFVNTPDINPLYLQTSGRAGFLVRAALAATMSGLWGLYSGFELCEAAALPGREEYLDSEKYELRPRDWAQPGNIVAEIAQLNHIRRENPALHSHLGISFYNAFNDQIIYFAKATPDRDNVVLVAVNLDPHHVQEADVEIPLWEWGLPDHGALAAEDLLTGERFTWHGKIQHLRLDPGRNPYAIWRIGAPGVS